MNTLSTLTQENTSISTNEINTIGFFPGLGSRTFYRDIRDNLYTDGSFIIKEMYEEAAEAKHSVLLSDAIPKNKLR